MKAQEMKSLGTLQPLQSRVSSESRVEYPPSDQDQRQKVPSDGGVRDELARYRSMLANERTLLAYQRTAIMLAVSGFTLLKMLSHQTYALVLGAGLLSIGLGTAIIEFARFHSMRHRLGE